ncbi:MAG: hypothetical protein VYE14_08005, partial [Verrucomicrobiota bacterium]|nr:hypothetical protein [Verrucomicrobiota bacterium]
MQCVHSAKVGFPTFGQAAQRCDGRLVLSLKQQASRCAAMPTVRVIQRRNQLGTSRLAKRCNSRLHKKIWVDAVNT